MSRVIKKQPKDTNKKAHSDTALKNSKIKEQKKKIIAPSIKQTKNTNTPKEKIKKIKQYDYLLECLHSIAEMFEVKTSINSFKHGLPLKNDLLTIDMFGQAATKANLTSKIAKRELKEIDEHTLPCILILKNHKACVITNINLLENKCEISFPDSGPGLSTIEYTALSEIYTGICIFVKRMYRYDQRSINLEVTKPQAWFWDTIKKSSRIYTQVIISSLLLNIFVIATPLFVMNVYDRVAPNEAIETLNILTIGIIGVLIFDFILKNLKSYFVDTAGKKADIILSSKIFTAIMSIKLSHKPQSSGGFANSVKEFETLRDFFSSATLVSLTDVPFVLLFLIVICLIGGPLAIIPLIAIPLIGLGSYYSHTKLSDIINQDLREAGQKHAVLIESISSLETIKSFGLEGKMQKNWENCVKQSAESTNNLKFLGNMAINYTALIQHIAYIMVVFFGIYLMIDGSMTMGGVIASSMLTSRSLAPLAQIVGLLTRLNKSMTSLRSLDEIMHTPSEITKDKQLVSKPYLRGMIQFKNVYFSYPNQEYLTLNNLNLNINIGEKIALLGKIGSGKSTIGKLVLNLYSTEKGSVLVDGIDTKQIDHSDLRKNIGYVPQDVYLFFGSIRENLTFGRNDITEDELLRASEASGVLDFVRRHPLGFDMQVGEGGCLLSGGQKQAVAVARALIRKPSIFIMDEPTAMMDQPSEIKLLQRLIQYTAGKTFILITHRPQLLRLVDKIAIIDSGKVVMQGPRNEIITKLTKQNKERT